MLFFFRSGHGIVVKFENPHSPAMMGDCKPNYLFARLPFLGHGGRELMGLILCFTERKAATDPSSLKA